MAGTGTTTSPSRSSWTSALIDMRPITVETTLPIFVEGSNPFPPGAGSPAAPGATAPLQAASKPAAVDNAQCARRAARVFGRVDATAVALSKWTGAPQASY